MLEKLPEVILLSERPSSAADHVVSLNYSRDSSYLHASVTHRSGFVSIDSHSVGDEIFCNKSQCDIHIDPSSIHVTNGSSEILSFCLLLVDNFISNERLFMTFLAFGFPMSW